MKPLRYAFRCSSLAIVVAMLLLGNQGVRADDKLTQTLKQQSEDVVKGYIQPIADLFGANMQAGWFHSAKIPEAGLNFTVSLVGMGAVVGDDQKSYTANSPYGKFQTATVFGGKGGTIQPPNGVPLSPIHGSDGIFNASMFPLASPQVRIGSIYGTEAALRWLPTVKAGELGDVSFFGFAARHNISQYLMDFPVDVAAGFVYSKFKVGSLLDFSGLSIGAQASKSFSLLTLYTGAAWEKTTLNLQYTHAATATSVNIDLDGANKFRFTVGAGLDLFLLTLFADANLGAVTNFSGGIAFGF